MQKQHTRGERNVDFTAENDNKHSAFIRTGATNSVTSKIRWSSPSQLGSGKRRYIHGTSGSGQSPTVEIPNQLLGKNVTPREFGHLPSLIVCFSIRRYSLVHLQPKLYER